MSHLKQPVRILDILVIGPLMLWGGLKLREENPTAGSILALFGLTTIGYNAANYYIESRRPDPDPDADADDADVPA